MTTRKQSDNHEQQSISDAVEMPSEAEFDALIADIECLRKHVGKCIDNLKRQNLTQDELHKRASSIIREISIGMDSKS